jgi:hypothetical protein
MTGALCAQAIERDAVRVAYSLAVKPLKSGRTLPCTKTLLRYAEATGSKLQVRLSAA